LRGTLQSLELLGLVGDPGGDLLEIAGHIRQLDSQGADPRRQLVDQLRIALPGGRFLHRFRDLHFIQHCVHDRDLKKESIPQGGRG
jgi:hypothetical protein